MCFSASASFTAGAVLCVAGAVTLPQVRDRRELAFAALPLAFGVHQLLEGVIWMQVDRAGETALRTSAVVAWQVFAWFVLPVLVPLAVRLFEPDPTRRRWMAALAVLGAAIGAYLLLDAVQRSSTVTYDQHHLQYQLPLQPGWVLALPYVAATCLPLLLHSARFVNLWGMGLLASLAVTCVFANRELPSVWCFFAAILSSWMVVHYALERREATTFSQA